MLRIIEEGIRFVFFYNFPIIHKDDSISDSFGESHFMGYHDHCHSLISKVKKCKNICLRGILF